MVQLAHLYMNTGKTIALPIWTFVSRVMSLLFNTLFRFVKPFLPRSKRLLVSWMQSPSTVILVPKKIKSVTVSIFPRLFLPWGIGLDATILVFWILSSKSAFSCSSFIFMKRLFSSSLLYAIRVVPSAYLRLLMFLPAILIPSCASFSPAFHMMYSAYNLNKQSVNIQPWCTPLPILNLFADPCLVLTVASWPEYRFLRRLVRWSGIPIS